MLSTHLVHKKYTFSTHTIYLIFNGLQRFYTFLHTFYTFVHHVTSYKMLHQVKTGIRQTFP